MKFYIHLSRLFSALVIISLLFPGCSDDISNMGPGDGEESDDKQTLILISLDGFRHDYLEKATTPSLDNLIANGVKANALIPVFPSKTFPNHFTQVTGLYPENHGIVSNTMYDPVFDEIFSLGSSAASDGKWYEGEPVWATAEKQGLISATYFWPGSDAQIMDIRPSYYFEFDGTVPYIQRTNQVITWLRLPNDQRPDFITLYFQSPDPEGHREGPDSPNVLSACTEVDAQIGILTEQIRDLNLGDQVNMMIVSDHGMTGLSRDSMIFIDDYIDLDDVFVVNWSPILELIPNAGMEDEIYEALFQSHPKLSVYSKSNMPARFHFNNHRRIAPIIGIASEGWSISDRLYFQENPHLYLGGTHGFDPENPEMWGIFVASGPSFRKGLSISPFECVHLYELMCSILGIVPSENDGDISILQGILQD